MAELLALLSSAVARLPARVLPPSRQPVANSKLFSSARSGQAVDAESKQQRVAAAKSEGVKVHVQVQLEFKRRPGDRIQGKDRFIDFLKDLATSDLAIRKRAYEIFRSFRFEFRRLSLENERVQAVSELVELCSRSPWDVLEAGRCASADKWKPLEWSLMRWESDVRRAIYDIEELTRSEAGALRVISQLRPYWG